MSASTHEVRPLARESETLPEARKREIPADLFRWSSAEGQSPQICEEVLLIPATGKARSARLVGSGCR